jgi:hypothetical protein
LGGKRLRFDCLNYSATDEHIMLARNGQSIDSLDDMAKEGKEILSSSGIGTLEESSDGSSDDFPEDGNFLQDGNNSHASSELI